MARGSAWRISDRIRISPQGVSGLGNYQRRPFGVHSGNWMCWAGLVWVRLGRRSSWQDEDMDAEMIKPVKP